jgi:hypothetical protein
MRGSEKVFKDNYCHSVSTQIRRGGKDEQAEETRWKAVPSPLLKEIPRGRIA